MISHIQKFREALDSGRLCLGTAITFSDPSVTEALCDSVDFLWIDLEHSPISLESMQSHLIAARAGGAPVVVRVPSSDIAWTKRVLDTGAEGIVLPQAQSAQDVRDFVSACRYPNMGTRGYGPRRPSNYGRNGGDDYIRHANENLFVAVQIESVGAYNDLDEILAVDGLDSVFLGPNDLSGSMGMPYEISHPDVVAAVETTISKAKQAGKYVGIGMADDAQQAASAASLGAQWVQCGGDFGYLVSYADQLFARIRERVTSGEN